MKRTILTVALLLAAVAAQAEIHGSWTATLDEKRPDRMHVQMNRGRQHNMGMTMRLAAFTGLTDAQIRAGVSTPVQFALKSEAGTVTYDGTFRKGDGAGQFSFTGNPSYFAAVRNLGVDPRLSEHRDRDDSEEKDLFSLAVHDVSTNFIRSMIAEGYRVDLDDYLSMRIFNVTPELVRELRSLGYKDISSEDLVSTRIHGVTPDYIRQMRDAGWNLTMDEFVASRIHGATPEFAAEMRKLGYGNLDHDDLVAFRIHGVTAKFISELRDLGYRNVDADDLVAMRIHRVTPEFIRSLEKAGYKNIPVDKLVSMRIHGIDATFVERMNEKN